MPFVLVLFKFLHEDNNTATVPILSSDGSIVTMDEFLNEAFERAVRLLLVHYKRGRKWDAQDMQNAKGFLREGATVEVEWCLGGDATGYTDLSRTDGAWTEAAQMISESRGLHYVIIKKSNVHWYEFLTRLDDPNRSSTRGINSLN